MKPIRAVENSHLHDADYALVHPFRAATRDANSFIARSPACKTGNVDTLFHFSENPTIEVYQRELRARLGLWFRRWIRTTRRATGSHVIVRAPVAALERLSQ